jgi:hypothetical protein
MHRRSVVLALLALGLVLTAFSGRPRRATIARQEVTVAPHDASALDGPTRLIAVERPRARAALQELGAAARQPPGALTGLPEESDEEPPGVAEHPPVTLDPQAAVAFDREFFSAAIDRRASEKALQEILSTVGTVSPATVIRDSGCTASLCRIELIHQTDIEQSEIAERIGEAAPLGLDALYYNATESDDLITIVYKTRDDDWP